MNTFVVTGAAGFIGSHLVARLLADGHRVIGVDWLTYAGNVLNLDVEANDRRIFLPLFGSLPRRHALYAHYAEEDGHRLAEFAMEAKEARELSFKVPDLWTVQPVPTREDLDMFLERWAGEGGRFVFVLADVANTAIWPPLLKHAGGVFHLAAETHVDRSFLDVEGFLFSDIHGTVALLQEAHRMGYGGRILHMSTDEVYGETFSPASEDASLDATNPYALSKLAADRFANAFFTRMGLDGVVVRPTNIFGPRQHPEKFIPLMVIRALRDVPLPVYGDGRQERSWLFVEDAVDGLIRAWERGKSGSVYNLGAPTPTPNLEVVKRILSLLGKDESLIRFVKDRPVHDRRYWLDSTKAREELGWSPRISLDEGLKQTVSWYREHAEWWERIVDHDPAFRSYFEAWYGERLSS